MGIYTTATVTLDRGLTMFSTSFGVTTDLLDAAGSATRVLKDNAQTWETTSREANRLYREDANDAALSAAADRIVSRLQEEHRKYGVPGTNFDAYSTYVEVKAKLAEVPAQA